MSENPSRKILLCVSGMSPAVITETLYALVVQEPPWIPDEIHIVTTLTGKAKIVSKLLSAETGKFHQFVREYCPGHRIRFDDSTVHVISQISEVTKYAGLLGTPVPITHPECLELRDITTDADNQAAGDTVYRVMRELKLFPGTQLHASVAGGRKSMSFYMGHAFSLLAQPQDKLSHVLVNDPFENPGFDFYYPPKQPTTLSYTDFKGETKEVNTADAHIQLADLSVLKLGSLLGAYWPEKAQKSFSFAVELAQAALVEPEIRVVLSSEDEAGWLEVCGEKIELAPLQFSIFALYAIARKHQDELPDGAQLTLADLPYSLWGDLALQFGKKMDAKAEIKLPDLPTATSRIYAALRDAVGPVSNHFAIEPVGKKTKGSHRPFMLKTAPDNIVLVGLHKWLRLLQGAL